MRLIDQFDNPIKSEVVRQLFVNSGSSQYGSQFTAEPTGEIHENELRTQSYQRKFKVPFARLIATLTSLNLILWLVATK